MADDKHSDMDDIIASVMKAKLKNYLAGKISSEIVRQHHKLPKVGSKIKEDEAPTNAMGHSSSVSGTGSIDTFDPLLFAKTARRKGEQGIMSDWIKSKARQQTSKGIENGRGK